MIETHMAGFAGLGLPRFLNREGVARVAGIAGGSAESRICSFQILYLSDTFDSDLVASSAAFHALGENGRLPVHGRHGLHCGPGEGMFSRLILLHLRIVAGRAGIRSGDLSLGHVVGRRMLVAMTYGAIKARLAMFA